MTKPKTTRTFGDFDNDLESPKGANPPVTASDDISILLAERENAQREVTALLQKLTKSFGENVAHQIFSVALKRPRGKRPTPEHARTDRWLLAVYDMMAASEGHQPTVRSIANTVYQLKMAHSVAAAERRIHRVLKERKKRDR